MIDIKKILLVANVDKEHVLKFHIPTIKMLSEEGYIIDVACAGQEEIPYCNRKFSVSYERSPFNLKLFKGIKELKHIVEHEKYDVIYCHTPVGGLAARLASINVRKKGTSVIYFAHGYHFYHKSPRFNWIVYYTIEKLLSKITDAIILINREDYFLTQKKFANCKAYLLDGIGVDVSKFKTDTPSKIRQKYRVQLGIPQNAKVLIYLAELNKNKNQTFLMRCVKRLLNEKENIYLILAGVDHSNGKMKKYAEKIGIEQKVLFLGWRDDVAELYATSDICVASSIREGFGLNVVEAMFCEKPVVATKNRGHETIIHNGKNGFLVNHGDEKDFVEKVLLLIRNPNIADKIITEAKRELKKYQSENVLKAIKNIIEEYL